MLLVKYYIAKCEQRDLFLKSIYLCAVKLIKYKHRCSKFSDIAKFCEVPGEILKKFLQTYMVIMNEFTDIGN